MTCPDTRKIAIVTLVLCCILTACSSKTPKKSAIPEPAPISAENPEALLGEAAITFDPVYKNSLLFRAAQLYWVDGLRAQSLAVMKEINTSLLTSEQRNQALLQQLSAATYSGDRLNAEQILKQLSIDELLRTDIEQQIARIELLQEAYTLTESHFAAALLLISQRGILLDDAKYNEQIWGHLGLSSALEINQYTAQNDYDVEGWLALSEAIRYRQSELEDQYQALLNWLESWPLHPAAIQLPQELEILSRLPENKPKQIILALPYSGPLASVGTAIRDGFIARYYRSSQFEGLNLRFYDTHQNNFLGLYDERLDEQSIIIGPLEKNLLSQLMELDALPYKTIALNQLPGTRTVDNLFQFSLNPEHESIQILERLEAEEQSRIAILAPESDWGLRIYDRLAQQLEDKQGQLVSSAFYQDQKTLAGAVARLLNTDKSKARARKIRRITGLRLESTPRRRQDLDAVIMIATPEIARQLKPLLAYHYAGDLPVYATSQINSGNKQENNRDLNGISFLDMPWALRAAIDIKNELETQFPNLAQQYSRFYAMGVDAFQIAPRIEILTQVENSHIEGQTGRLSIDEENRVQRSLQWAKFRGGRPVIMN